MKLFLVVSFLTIFLAGCIQSKVKTFDKSPPDIVWDQVSLQQLAKPLPAADKGHFSYPRMIESADGRLYCVYEHNGNIEIINSGDGGKSWAAPLVITTARNRINVANPEIIELKNGELIVAYNLRPRPENDGTYNPDKKFSICIKKSRDKGKSWEEEKVLYRAGSDFKNGCWEPSMVQLPTGEVCLFFANEGIYTQSNEQNISVLTSDNNGESWSNEPLIVSFAKKFRDGMPVPIYEKKSKEVLFAIEDNSEGGEFNPSIIKVSDDRRFLDINNANRIRLLNDEISTKVYAGAPYLRQLDNGVFILSFQSTLNRNADWRLSTMDVATANNIDNFKITSRPFEVPLNKSALWNSICVTRDNSIIALTSTNAFNDYSAIWMIKGKLNKKP